MIVYKYLSEDRIDVLENSMIRATQYGKLNDEFELPAWVINMHSEKDLLEVLKEASNNLGISIGDDTQSILYLNEYMPLMRVLSNITELFIKNNVKKSSNNLMGIISLSKTCEEDLMWSHYAQEGRGFVVGFDSNSSFFNRKRSENDIFYCLRAVKYGELKPIDYTNDNMEDMFITKKKKWEYEQEVRMLLPFKESDKAINDIHLFKFPPNAISCIILGYNISDVFKNKIVNILNTEKYKHVKLYYAVINNHDYKIEIKRDNK